MTAAAGLFAVSQAAYADMGKAPAGTQGVYLSFEGGYLHQDGTAVTGHGIVLTPGGSEQDVLVSPEDGGFAGGQIGFATGQPFLFGLSRVEVYVLFGAAEESRTDSAPPLADLALITVDGVTLAVGGGLRGYTSVERDTREFGFRVETDAGAGGLASWTWSFAPFVRSIEEDTYSTVQSCCDVERRGDVDTWLYGFVVSAEPEVWVTPNIAFVGRLGAGVYGYDGEGKFRSRSNFTPDAFAAYVSDSESGVGFRGLLGAGVKLKVAPGANLEGFAEADYFSNVPTGQMSTNSSLGSYESYVEDEDLWELRTGIRLTVGFGAASAAN